MKAILGIDPGKSGTVAVLDEGGDLRSRCTTCRRP